MSAKSPESLSVLIVDDDVQLLKTTADILRMHGYTPIPAASALAALKASSTLGNAPCIALVDLQLPDMDGIELVARLRALSSVTEVVILTGNATMESALSALREESYDYLIKPVAPDYLMATIDRAGERSQRRFAEAGRRESEERLRLIFDHVSDALFIANDAGCILDANPAACELTGMSVEELRLVPLEKVLPESIKPVGSSDNPGSHPSRGSTTDGRVLDVQAAVFAPGVLVYTVRDLTKQRRLEDQLGQSQKMDAVGQLAGGVAHDFNNLLTVILSYSALLQEDLAPDDPRSADIQQISAAATRGSALTQQLLTFSRKQVVQLRATDVNIVVREVEKILRRLIGEDIELVTTLESDPWPISGDNGQFEQVLINLAVNARDAMPNGGRIQIETANVEFPADGGADGVQDEVAGREYVMLAVTDTGVGMTRETQQRVFEPFFTTKDLGKGTGLGLSTVYGIVTQSGGTVAIESEPGHGATFRIYFPRLVDKSAAISVQETIRPSLHGAETILVVEDDPALRGLTARILQASGYKVLTASNGVEALEVAMAYSGPIDMVATDVIMPEMGGRALVERLMETHEDIKVLFMSGYTSDEVIRLGVLDGRTAFLQKPFAPNRFASVVRDVLDRPLVALSLA